MTRIAKSLLPAALLAMPTVEYYQDHSALYRYTNGTNDRPGKLEQLMKDGTQYWLVPPQTAFHGSFLQNLKSRKKAAQRESRDDINAAWQSQWEEAMRVLQGHLGQKSHASG